MQSLFWLLLVVLHCWVWIFARRNKVVVVVKVFQRQTTSSQFLTLYTQLPRKAGYFYLNFIILYLIQADKAIAKRDILKFNKHVSADTHNVKFILMMQFCNCSSVSVKSVPHFIFGPDKAIEKRDILKFNKHVSADTHNVKFILMLRLCNCSSVSVKSVTQSLSKSWSVSQPIIQSLIQSVIQSVSLLVTKRISYCVIKLYMDEAFIYPCLGKVIKSHLPFGFLFFFFPWHRKTTLLCYAITCHNMSMQIASRETSDEFTTLGGIVINMKNV